MRVPVGARGAHCLRVVRALPARGSAIAADVAGAGDGKLARGVLRIGGGAANVVNERGGVARKTDMGGGEDMGLWGDSCSVCCASRGMVPVVFALRSGPRLVAATGVGAEEAGAGRGEAMKAAWTTGTLVALAARSGDAARRTSGAGHELGLSGGYGASDGERPLHALRTQEVVKVVPGSTEGAGRRQYTAEEPRCAGRRRGDVGCKERQHRVQQVARVGLGFTPAWYRAEAGIDGSVRRGTTLHEMSVKKLPVLRDTPQIHPSNGLLSSAERGLASRQMRGQEWDWESRFRGIAGQAVGRRGSPDRRGSDGGRRHVVPDKRVGPRARRSRRRKRRRQHHRGSRNYRADFVGNIGFAPGSKQGVQDESVWGIRKRRVGGPGYAVRSERKRDVRNSR
ncbi:hypothetical protein B0H14DRAFT_3156175 [Mycena olivaceomarginata]|nr:hypothetical protein B0H14DRAFT_3156175 [Mycena olivaceomarginata]